MKKLIIAAISLTLFFSFTSLVSAKDKHFRFSEVKSSEIRKHHKRGDYSKDIRSLIARAKKIRKQLHHHFEIIKRLRAKLERIESKLKKAHHKGKQDKYHKGQKHHNREEYEAKRHHFKRKEFRKQHGKHKRDRKHNGNKHRLRKRRRRRHHNK